MIKEYKITELDKIKTKTEHILSSDGFHFDKNTYKFKQPINIELKNNETREHITFNKPVQEITHTTNLYDATYQLQITLQGNTTISIHHKNINQYTILI